MNDLLITLSLSLFNEKPINVWFVFQKRHLYFSEMYHYRVSSVLEFWGFFYFVFHFKTSVGFLRMGDILWHDSKSNYTNKQI